MFGPVMISMPARACSARSLGTNGRVDEALDDRMAPALDQQAGLSTSTGSLQPSVAARSPSAGEQVEHRQRRRRRCSGVERFDQRPEQLRRRAGFSRASERSRAPQHLVLESLELRGDERSALLTVWRRR